MSSSQFNGSVAYKVGEGEFLIKMSAFFAARLKSDTPDFAILKGIIAELEGLNPSNLTITVEGVASRKQDDNSLELESLIN